MGMVVFLSGCGAPPVEREQLLDRETTGGPAA